MCGSGTIEYSDFTWNVSITTWSGNDMMKISAVVDDPVFDADGNKVGQLKANISDKINPSKSGVYWLEFTMDVHCNDGSIVEIAEKKSFSHK